MAIMEKQEINVNGAAITVDAAILDFNENTLPAYLQKEGGWYAYYGSVLANAEFEEQLASMKADEKYDSLFWTLKSEGSGSDKYCESRAKSSADVVLAKETVIKAKRTVTLLKTFLKAMDKNHDNAQSTGHNLRKELDKLGQAGERFGGASDEDRLGEFFHKRDML